MSSSLPLLKDRRRRWTRKSLVLSALSLILALSVTYKLLYNSHDIKFVVTKPEIVYDKTQNLKLVIQSEIDAQSAVNNNDEDQQQSLESKSVQNYSSSSSSSSVLPSTSNTRNRQASYSQETSNHSPNTLNTLFQTQEILSKRTLSSILNSGSYNNKRKFNNINSNQVLNEPHQYRQGKVFVLLLQQASSNNRWQQWHRKHEEHLQYPIFSDDIDGSVSELIENVRKSLFIRQQIKRQQQQQQHSTQTQYKRTSKSANYEVQLLPKQIEFAIKILEAQRIEYVIDKLQSNNALPQSLLDTQQQASVGNGKRVSVIIIDDFVKYTLLNRWTRDQLDRFCRDEQIGVVAFFDSSFENLIQLSKSSTLTSYTTNSSDYLASTLTSSTSSESTSSRLGRALTDSQSFALNHFPLSIRPVGLSCEINDELFENEALHLASAKANVFERTKSLQVKQKLKQQNERRQKQTQAQSRGVNGEQNKTKPLDCLADYSVNDKSALLRLVKSKRNFVLPGPLPRNLANKAWLSISSNHESFEPLTYARLLNSIETTTTTTTISSNNDALSKQARLNLLNSSIADNANYADFNSNNVDDAVVYETGLKLSIANNYNYNDEHAKVADTDYTNDNYYSPADYYKNQQSSSTLTGEILSASNDKNLKDASTLISAPLSSFVAAPTTTTSPFEIKTEIETNDNSLAILSMVDKGLFDGVKRVLFGGVVDNQAASQSWLHKALLIEAVEHLSAGAILTSLDRFVQIDIDDVFVAETGKRMTRADVEALIEAQEDFGQRFFSRSTINNNNNNNNNNDLDSSNTDNRNEDAKFKFNLGYSGKHYASGNEMENDGDVALVESAQNFTWFCHTFSHSKAHLAASAQTIADELIKNRRFAAKHKLPLVGMLESPITTTTDASNVSHGDIYAQKFATYAIAPHHSGVYPVHEELFDAWSQVLNVTATSTEEYPHLRPASQRRGFSHRGVKILPRQTCGLYTHTVFRNAYPGGAQKLDAIIEGGELFETILHNPINVYMSHMSNYANDRLALYAFKKLFEFVTANTNIKLKFESPLKLANRYFAPENNKRELEVLWTNPCADKRHLDIWPVDYQTKFCLNVPQILIVGPQKTGSTAMLEFLKLNSNFKTSAVNSSADFEEVQFFNDKHYSRGVVWYLSHFASNRDKYLQTNSPQRRRQQQLIVDKSATYFDDAKVARRARALLPTATIVISLIEPGERAYSWYQHSRAHNESVAMRYSFEQVLAPSARLLAAEPLLVQLRNRCLLPGHYAQHLTRWLRYFPARQLIVVDGLWFKQNAAAVMNKLQALLLTRIKNKLLYNNNKPTIIDYNERLVFDSRKGFFCMQQTQTTTTNSSQPHCLGPSKGRKYLPMSKAARSFLNTYYRTHNANLARLFNQQLGGQPLPIWLERFVAQQI